MKKLLFVILVILTSRQLSAQHFDLGIHGAVNATWLLNSNVNDQGPNLNPVATFASSFGVGGRYMFNDRMGAKVELNLTSVDQKYDGTVAISNVSFDARTNTNWIELPVLFMLESDGGFYFEIGPQFSFLSKATETVTSTPSDPSLEYSKKDFKDNFKSTQVAGAFGLGGNFPVGGPINILAGLRFTYAFTDAIEELPQDEFITELVEGDLSIPATFAHLDQSLNYKYEKTTILTGGFRLGVVYVFGSTD